MSRRDWRPYADDIVQSCGKVRRFIAGMTYEAFAADDATTKIDELEAAVRELLRRSPV